MVWYFPNSRNIQDLQSSLEDKVWCATSKFQGFDTIFSVQFSALSLCCPKQLVLWNTLVLQLWMCMVWGLNEFALVGFQNKAHSVLSNFDDVGQRYWSLHEADASWDFKETTNTQKDHGVKIIMQPGQANSDGCTSTKLLNLISDASTADDVSEHKLWTVYIPRKVDSSNPGCSSAWYANHHSDWKNADTVFTNEGMHHQLPSKQDLCFILWVIHEGLVPTHCHANQCLAAKCVLL